MYVLYVCMYVCMKFMFESSITLEIIPQERLSDFETKEKGKLCIACNRPLPVIREHLDEFNIDVVESQEETPLPNPTEAQV